MFKIAKICGAAALFAVAIALRVKHGGEVSNIAQMFDRLGLSAPEALASPLADSIVSGLALTALSGLVFWWTFGPRTGATAASPKRNVPLSLYPDWSIAALFQHLDPALAGADDIEIRAVPTGQVVLEKLISGELKAWGKVDGSARTLRPIPPAFWAQASWTYWFLPDEKRNRELVHATLPRAAEQFRDVHVNHRQAMAVWPA